MPELLTPYRNYSDSEFTKSVTAARAKFVSDINAIVGRGNLRLLYVPALADTTTSADLSPVARTVTNNASLAGRLTAQGFGYLASYNGTSQGASMPDADDLSFGNGTTDSPFSIVALSNVTDTAAERVIFAKYNAGTTTREYYLAVNTVDGLSLTLADQTPSTQAPSRTSNSPITQGALHLLGATYSAATGGATAMNDVTFYQDAVLIASTAANNASYVAMENLGAPPEIASRNANGVSWFAGSMAMVLVCAGALSLAQMGSIKTQVNSFFGLAL